MNPPTSSLVGRIRSIRGHKVLLSSDLAVLYGVVELRKSGIQFASNALRRVSAFRTTMEARSPLSRQELVLTPQPFRM